MHREPVEHSCAKFPIKLQNRRLEEVHNGFDFHGSGVQLCCKHVLDKIKKLAPSCLRYEKNASKKQGLDTSMTCLRTLA
jgi:hypothetical protein